MENELLDLIISLNPMIYKISKRFYGLDSEDLYQAGIIGLIDAYNNYLPSMETKFSTYAYKYIFGEMYKLMLTSKGIKINKEVLLTYKEIERSKDYLKQINSKEPTLFEIAEFIGISYEDVYLITKSCESMLSLNMNYEDSTLEDLIADEIADEDLRIMIDIAIESLPEPDKTIIISRYYHDQTQSEIAKKLNLSQVKVSRIEKKSLSKIRSNIVN